MNRVVCLECGCAEETLAHKRASFFGHAFRPALLVPVETLRRWEKMIVNDIPTPRVAKVKDEIAALLKEARDE